MTDQATEDKPRLTRQQVSDAVGPPGWRVVVGVIRTSIRVTSLAQAADVARLAVTAAGPGAGRSLSADLRPDRVVLTLQSPDGWVGPPEVDQAQRISAAVREQGLATGPEVALDAANGSRSVQVLEIAIDALDIPAIRPFWQAVLGYGDEPGADGSDPGAALADPVGPGPDLLVPADGRAPPAAQPDPLRRGGPGRRDWAPDPGRAGRQRQASSTTPRLPPSGSWPTPRATKPASAPGSPATPEGRRPAGGGSVARVNQVKARDLRTVLEG